MGSAVIWGFHHVDSARQWWAIPTLQRISYKRHACNRISVPDIGICVLHLSVRHNKRLVGSAHPTRDFCAYSSVTKLDCCGIALQLV